MANSIKNSEPQRYAKTSDKTLRGQIDVVAEFHAHKISPLRIAYRTGVNIELVKALVGGESHQRLFKALVSYHRKARRDLLLKKSLRKKGIGQAELQEKIEADFNETINH